MACAALIVPLTPSQPLSGRHCPLGFSSGLLSPHCPLGPTSGVVGPSLFPLAPPQALPALTVPLSPCWAAQQPIQPSPSPRAQFGRCIPSARPPASLVVNPDPAFLLAPARPAGHSLLLEQHHVASRLGGCPLPARLPARFPAAAVPVAPPGPAACASSSWSAPSRRTRCGPRAGSCPPASPPPAPLPTPPGAPVPQHRAGAGRLCGNQSVTRSGAH